jgi:hypothetical protein
MPNNFRVKTLLADSIRVSGEIAGNNLLYTTGNQNISGIKNFYFRPTVNGTGILLSGDITSQPEATGVSGYLQGQITVLNNQTGSYALKSETGSFVTTSQTGAFYAASNPSGFITGINLSDYSTIPYTTGISGVLQSQISNLNSGTGSYALKSETGSFLTVALASGVATFLASPTSANLAAAVTNEVGSGALVFEKELQRKVATSNLTISGSSQIDPILTVNVVTGGIYKINMWAKLTSTGTAVPQGNLGGTCTLVAAKQTFIYERAGFNSENVVLNAHPTAYASFSCYNVAAGGTQGMGFRGTLTAETSGTLFFAFYFGAGSGTVTRLAGSFLEVVRVD